MQIYANGGCHGDFCGGETVVTGRGMRLKRAMGSGRTCSTHNAPLVFVYTLRWAVGCAR